ncbi:MULTISPECIES: TrkH family potassium uptake protein [unclassified Fusibacter]|uniref:TrkH family potassium uptake protein n=1 Tax=unclassified Fusibacter TaxID=2624464 RepID=UPI001010F5B3|nr:MULTISPECIES: TrkH family potassium uptake protein [unclassified Fusibacter]MCK8060930.1 TrkH family potassium uptake protein [Fusibacter sp. A2]NPE23226.1 TrkH family potassium uptake protein [Fusibacter sp. A1]RXV59581.1 TrkH family potassium uptake protein [Fusibacter sp. A1]
MNYRMIFKVMGFILLIIAAGMILPLLIALFTGEHDSIAFAVSLVLTAGVGYSLTKIPITHPTIKTKEGLAIVTFSWIFASVFGALPFVLSGSIPSFIDAFFETVSGFTTTGATIINNIEVLPKGILFWRSFTHWIGGMGILVVAVAILPMMGASGFHIFKAESPGPIADKIVPRIRDTAKILYSSYILVSLIEFVLLMLGGMSVYESAIHTFGTLGTGGFSTMNGSVGAFNNSYIFIVISIFMIMSGANFSLYYDLYKGKWRDVIKNSELRLYLGIIAISVIALTINNSFHVYSSWFESFTHSLFQTSSIITTTGYTTADYEQWSTFSQGILFLLMFVGGSAGSTGGSIKVIRILVLLKIIKREFIKILHPRAVVPVKLSGQPVSEDTLLNISGFFMLYMVIFIIGSLLISLEGNGITFIGATSAVAATLGNIGPGFGFVGPTHTYAAFSNASKLLLSFFMLLGRLELFTVVALLSPRFWRS